MSAAKNVYKRRSFGCASSFTISYNSYMFCKTFFIRPTNPPTNDVLE